MHNVGCTSASVLSEPQGKQSNKVLAMVVALKVVVCL